MTTTVVTTADKVAALRNKDSQMPAIEIAKQIGVSRERVRQILVSLGLPTRFELPPNLCRNCGAEISRESTTGLCRTCRQESLQATIVCDECGRHYRTLRSDGKAKQKRGYKHRFCSRRCLGGWLGKLNRRYDWGEVKRLRELGYTHKRIAQNLGASTGNIGNILKQLGLAKPAQKWDREKVCRMRKETGWSCQRIGTALGMPGYVVYRILVKQFGSPLLGVRRAPPVRRAPFVERECIGCGAIHTGGGLFCSIKCYDRIRALVKYYTGEHPGGRKTSLVPCSVCGTEVERASGNHFHFCGTHLNEYRRLVGERLKGERSGRQMGRGRNKR